MKLTKEQYQDYLKTEHWNNIKSQFKRDHCEICHAKEELHLHHLNYKYFHEELSDVATLCRACHTATHYDELGNRLLQQNPCVKSIIHTARNGIKSYELEFIRSRTVRHLDGID